MEKPLCVEQGSDGGGGAGGGGRVLKNNPKHTILITSKNWLAMQKLENLLKYPITSPALQFSAQMFH